MVYSLRLWKGQPLLNKMYSVRVNQLILEHVRSINVGQFRIQGCFQGGVRIVKRPPKTNLQSSL